MVATIREAVVLMTGNKLLRLGENLQRLAAFSFKYQTSNSSSYFFSQLMAWKNSNWTNEPEQEGSLSNGSNHQLQFLGIRPDVQYALIWICAAENTIFCLLSYILVTVSDFFIFFSFSL